MKSWLMWFRSGLPSPLIFNRSIQDMPQSTEVKQMKWLLILIHFEISRNKMYVTYVKKVIILCNKWKRHEITSQEGKKHIDMLLTLKSPRPLIAPLTRNDRLTVIFENDKVLTFVIVSKNSLYFHPLPYRLFLHTIRASSFAEKTVTNQYLVPLSSK